MSNQITIAFVKAADRHGGSVDGRLESSVLDGSSSGCRFLAELTDSHPDFAAHIVRCVNTYAAIFKVAQAEMGDGPITNALRELLRP